MLADLLVPILIAAIVASGPTILAVVTNRQRARDKAQDWARQDAVAAQAARAAELLKTAQDAAAAKAAEAARLLLASNAKAAEAAKSTSDKLDVIHTLVNSTLTETMEAQLEATVQQLTMMQRLLAGDAQAPSPESVSAVEEKITRMRAALNDRLEQTKMAEAQIARTAPTKGFPS